MPFTVPTDTGQQVALSAVTVPYRVRSVRIQAELELVNEHGKATGVIQTSVEPIFEAFFFPGLVEFLKRQGVHLDDPAPVEVAPVEVPAP